MPCKEVKYLPSTKDDSAIVLILKDPLIIKDKICRRIRCKVFRHLGDKIISNQKLLYGIQNSEAIQKCIINDWIQYAGSPGWKKCYPLGINNLIPRG